MLQELASMTFTQEPVQQDIVIARQRKVGSAKKYRYFPSERVETKKSTQRSNEASRPIAGLVVIKKSA